MIDKLYDQFLGATATTMKTYFETWMEWREKKTSVSRKTIRENRFMWNSLLKNQDITSIPLKELTAKDLIIYFRNITKGRQIIIKNHLGDDFYSLAVKLDFYLILRIGELK